MEQRREEDVDSSSFYFLPCSFRVSPPSLLLPHCPQRKERQSPVDGKVAGGLLSTVVHALNSKFQGTQVLVVGDPCLLCLYSSVGL